jgi:hypothetical protein
MNKPMVRIVELDGTVIDREMTNAEFAQYELDIANAEAAKAAREQALAEAQAKRQALLAKLGITEDEARLLLGGN